MRSNVLQIVRTAVAVLVIAALLCCEIAIGTAKADSPANARALHLPEGLLLCQPLDDLERDRVQLGQTRTGLERNSYLYGKTDRSKAICF